MIFTTNFYELSSLFESLKAFSTIFLPVVHLVFGFFVLLLYLSVVFFYVKSLVQTTHIYWILYKEAQGLPSTPSTSSSDTSNSCEDGEKPKPWWQKVKHHLQNHWPWYLGGAIVLGVGLGVYYSIGCQGLVVETLTEAEHQQKFEAFIESHVEESVAKIEQLKATDPRVPILNRDGTITYIGSEPAKAPFGSRDEYTNFLLDLRCHSKTQELLKRLEGDLPQLEAAIIKFESANDYKFTPAELHLMRDVADTFNDFFSLHLHRYHQTSLHEPFFVENFFAVVKAEGQARGLNILLLDKLFWLWNNGGNTRLFSL